MTTLAQWQRELQNFVGIKSLFVIEGNVCDLYPWGLGADVEFLPLPEVLARAFNAPLGPDGPSDVSPASASPSGDPGHAGPYRLLFCDPLRGITDPLGDPVTPALVRAAAREAESLLRDEASLNLAQKPQPFADNRLVHDALVLRAALTRRLDLDRDGSPRVPRPAAGGQGPAFSTCCVYDFASRVAASPADLSPEENAVFMNLYLGAADAVRGDGSRINALVLVVNRLTDVPSWFLKDNPRARTLIVPNPSRAARQAYVDAAFPGLAEPGLARVRRKFVDTTDGMKLLEIDELRRLHARSGAGASEVCGLVDVYKHGFKENRWAAVAERLHDGPAEALRRRVKGQDRAIEKIVAVLKRSAAGFSGMQHSSDSKPKGVLFLAGPTGTGKTEVVKAVTELLFGDERSCQRFDMSEYATENSDQRLFGAPPGYVGYDQGGQLTNAVKANPFCVLLFDEIEKAHPSIMDKFLQILEDGRMTDGQGNTVWFGETIIFFTSNVGISEEVYDATGHVVGRRSVVEPGEPYEDIERKVNEAMARHFKPEVLGRIGDNVVVFDYIGDEASRLIVRAQLSKIAENVHQRSGIAVEATEACLALLDRQAREPAVREKGGRGIGNLVEAAYLNPLAAFVFDSRIGPGETVVADAAGDRVAFARKG